MTNAQTARTTDGIDIRFETVGTGPSLVLVHGITENRRAWADHVPGFAERYTVTTLDLRGHGESDLADVYDIEALTKDVRSVVETLGAAEPALVGHSLGGLVATAYAAAYPVRAIVNVDQPLQLGDLGTVVRELEPALRGDGFQETMNGLMESLAGDRLSTARKTQLRELRGPARPDVVLSIWEPFLSGAGPDFAEMIEGLLRQIRAPYLALHGSDPGPNYAEWLRRLAPTATVETWDGMGHWLHHVEPDRFTERVLRFLDD
jgi:pimeloyl-ACP methyl ester carboxylesterase